MHRRRVRLEIVDHVARMGGLAPLDRQRRPAIPRDRAGNLVAGGVQDRLIGRSLPWHHGLDDPVQPLPLGILRLDAGELVRARGGVVDQLREQHRPARRQRPPRPP